MIGTQTIEFLIDASLYATNNNDHFSTVNMLAIIGLSESFFLQSRDLIVHKIEGSMLHLSKL